MALDKEFTDIVIQEQDYQKVPRGILADLCIMIYFGL